MKTTSRTPGFTAEATLRPAGTPYGFAASIRSSTAFAVMPQLQPQNPTGFCVCEGDECFCGPTLISAPFGAGGYSTGGVNRAEIACRSYCYRKFGTNTVLRKACLEEC